jgi:ectoine hydroxylase-related dioxygenase (phytanoyl-CoA dioxygenase family)
MEQYRELGFISLRAAFSDQEVAGAVQALDDLMASDLAETVELQFEHGTEEIVKSLPPSERLDYVRKFMWFSHHHQGTTALMRHPGLLELVGRLLGGKPEMFQDMCLVKPPGIGREKPWHQDHAYFNLPEGTPVVGVWIALDDATPENGCMHLLPGRHRDGVIPHWNRRDWQICDADVLGQSGQAAAPFPAGGCLIFDGMIPHGTPANNSGTRRRALQYHYVVEGTPRTTTEERMALFGSEGRDVSC